MLSYCTKLLLKSLILEEKLFKLEYVNARIGSFDYSYHSALSKPSVISHNELTASDTAGLGQSDVIMSPVTTVHKAVLLRQQINEHHELFRELYSGSSITPKMHYMIHLPAWIIQYGPMTWIWCMRFEAQHKLLKQLSTAMCNFANISKSLANQFQQHMCDQQLNNENYLKQETSVPKTLSNHDKQGALAHDDSCYF